MSERYKNVKFGHISTIFKQNEVESARLKNYRRKNLAEYGF